MDTNVEQFHLPVCQSCGGEYEHISENKYKCKNCGNVHFINNPLSSPITSASIREGTILRNDGYFDKAESHFMDVIEKSSNPADLAEAYWGRFLCEYGIIHVRDKKTGTYLPTACHRIMSIPAQKDKYYLKALEYCDSQLKKEEYTKGAEYIENIRLRQIEEAKKEPYQIFISHKKTIDNPGASTESYTRDYIQSGKLYRFLTGKGYKVFFADESLTKGSVGSAFEAQIFTAIATSKVMIVLGSCKEHLNAPYVKNEWTRFLRQQEYDHEKVIIPVLIDGMPPNQLPSELRKIEGLEMDADFNEKLLKQLEVIFKNDKAHDIKTKILGARDAKKATKVSGVEKRSFTNSGIEAKKLLIQQERDIDVAFRYLGEHAYSDAKYILTKQIEYTDDVDEIVDFGLKQISIVPKLIKAEFNHALDQSVFNAFNEAVKGAPDGSREIIFNYFENFTLEALKVSNISWGVKLYSTIMAWDYEGRDKFDDKVRDLAHSWLDKTTPQMLKNYTLLMKEVLKFDEGGIDNYLLGLNTCADNILAAGNKEAGVPKTTIRELALSFYNDIVEHDEGDYKTRWKIILFKTGTTEEKYLKNVISNFTFFQEFQLMLEFTPEKIRHDYVDKLINAIIGGTKDFLAKKSNNKVDPYLTLFNEAITFTGNGKDIYLRGKLYEFARVLQDAYEFLHAITYYNMIVREKPDECDAHWGLLQCKTNSRNDDELIAQKKPIHRMKEFTNAYQAAGSNETKVNYYLEVKRKQGKHTVSTSTEKRYKRNKTYGIFAIIFALISLGVGFYAFYLITDTYSIAPEIAINPNFPMFMACGLGTLLAIILGSIGLKKPAEKNKAKIILNVVTTLFLVVSMFSSFVAYKSFIGFKVLLNHDGKVTEYFANPYTNEISFIPVKDGKKFVAWNDANGETFLVRGENIKDFIWQDGVELHAVWEDVTVQSVTTQEQITNIVNEINSWALLDCSQVEEGTPIKVTVPKHVSYLKVSGNGNVLDISFDVGDRSEAITLEFENVIVNSTSTLITSTNNASVNVVASGTEFDFVGNKQGEPARIFNVNGDLMLTFNEEVKVNEGAGKNYNLSLNGGIKCNDLTIKGSNGGGWFNIQTDDIIAIEASMVQIDCSKFTCYQYSNKTEGAIIACSSLIAEVDTFELSNEGNANNSPIAIQATSATIKANSQINISAVYSFKVSEKLSLEFIQSEVQPLSESAQLCETGAIECGELSLLGGNYNIAGIEKTAIKAINVSVKVNKLNVVSLPTSNSNVDLVSCENFNAEVEELSIVCENYNNNGANALVATNVNIKVLASANIEGGRALGSACVGGNGIVATNVVITGEENTTLTVEGGNGYLAVGNTGATGGNGGNAICANDIQLSGLTAHLFAGAGGTGAQGTTGNTPWPPSARGQHNEGGTKGYRGYDGYQGGTGGKGGTGGNSGRAIANATTLSISNSAFVHLYEANSGAGGKGGTGGAGSRGGEGGAGTDAKFLGRKGSDGGDGGTGGKGGTGGPGGDGGVILNAIQSGVQLNSEEGCTLQVHTQTASGGAGAPGAGGAGGAGGTGGRAGDGITATYSRGSTGAPGATGSNGTVYGSARTHE